MLAKLNIKLNSNGIIFGGTATVFVNLIRH